MGNQKLTPAEISQLMAAYESELRKLEFQRGALTEAILKLQKQIGITEITVEPTTELIIETAKPERKKPGPKAGAKKAAVTTVPAETKPAQDKPGKKKSKPESTDTPVTPPLETTPETPAKTRKPRADKQETAPAAPVTKGKAGRPKKVKEDTTTENISDTIVEKPKGKGKGKGRPPKSAAPEAAETKPKAQKEKKSKETKEIPVKETAGKIKAEEILVKSEVKGKPGPKATYSKWDRFIFDLIKKVARPMTSADIIDAMKAERDSTKEPLGDTALAQQLNRTLQKLGSKLDLLKKEPYSGKGKVYSLKSPNAQLPE